MRSDFITEKTETSRPDGGNYILHILIGQNHFISNYCTTYKHILTVFLGFFLHRELYFFAFVWFLFSQSVVLCFIVYIWLSVFNLLNGFRFQTFKHESFIFWCPSPISKKVISNEKGVIPKQIFFPSKCGMDVGGPIHPSIPSIPYQEITNFDYDERPLQF